MKRRALVVVMTTTLAAMGACTHDWSYPLASGDAGVDGGKPDTSTPVVGPDAANFNCTGALVCDQFDTPPLGTKWDDVAVGPGGKAAIEPFDRAFSGDNVFVAERPPQTDGTSTAYISKVWPQPLTRARMELQVWPIALDANEYATIAAIVFNHQGAEHKLRLALTQTKAQLQELGPSSVIASHDLPTGIPFDKWTPIAFEIVEKRIHVFVDGNQVIDVQAGPTWTLSMRSLFVVGINFVTRPHGNVHLRFDDVRVTGGN